MLSFHPEKPQLSLAAHDNYLTDPAWIKGFGLLEKYELSFDLLILPHQMSRYGEGVYVKVTIIISLFNNLLLTDGK